MAKAKYLEWLEPDKLILLEGWARDGLTEAQIAHNMGIGLTTLKEWRKKHPPIETSLKKGKEVADFEIENALYKRAHGYDYEETIEELKFNRKTGEYELKVTKRMKKHMPPDATSMIYWLKNRMPEKWRDKRIVEDHVEFESDGFIEALKAQSGETFKEGDSIVEE